MGGNMHICALGDVFDAEQASYVAEALEVALAEAEEVLERHASEEPPTAAEQSTSEAAEAFLKLYETQQRRVQALKDALRKAKEVQ
jgi:benzoyl-CoA reductase/2-hydroxyglutaryl-CoA dehydratase subunit BcrC/BadD/HgdB